MKMGKLRVRKAIQNSKNRAIPRLLLIAGTIMAGAYTNCSRESALQPEIQKINNLQGNLTGLNLHETLSPGAGDFEMQSKQLLPVAMNEKLTIESCRNSNFYFCDHRIYSTHIRSSTSKANYNCLRVRDFDVCPLGLEIKIDSSSLQSYCTSNDCENPSSESDEFHCYFDSSGGKQISALQKESNTLEEGILKIYETCLSLIEPNY